MRKETKKEIYLYNTGVENLFIAEFLPAAPGDAVKVYIYALMFTGLHKTLSNEQIARVLKLSVSDVEDAWAYWEKAGLVTRVYDGDSYDIEFVRLKEKLYGRKNEDFSLGDEEEETTSPLADESIHDMFISIEEIIGQPLSDVTSIYGWIDKYGASPETIVEAFRYAAVSRKNTRTSYVEAIVKEWAEKGLLSAEKIQEHLEAHDVRHTLYRRVLRSLGLYRNPTEEEERLIDSWFDELGFDITRVLDACSKTAGISNPNIKYINTVLRGWYRDEHGMDPSSSKEEAAGSVTAAFVKKRMAEYVALREAEEADAEMRRNAVYEKFPRVKEIEEEMHSLAMNVSKMALAGHGLGASAAMKRRIEALEIEKNNILASCGLTPEDLEVHYTCAKCRDTGYLEDGSRCDCFVGK